MASMNLKQHIADKMLPENSQSPRTVSETKVYDAEQKDPNIYTIYSMGITSLIDRVPMLAISA